MKRLSLEKVDGGVGAEERNTLEAFLLKIRAGLIRLVIQDTYRAAGCYSPVVLLLGREGPGDVQGVNLANRHHCKGDDVSCQSGAKTFLLGPNQIF